MLTFDIFLVDQPELNHVFHLPLFIHHRVHDEVPALLELNVHRWIVVALLTSTNQRHQFVLSLVKVVECIREILLDFDQSVVVRAKIVLNDREILFDGSNVIVPFLAAYVHTRCVIVTAWTPFQMPLDQLVTLAIVADDAMQMFRSFVQEEKVIRLQTLDEVTFRLQDSIEFVKLAGTELAMAIFELCSLKCCLHVSGRLGQFIETRRVGLFSMLGFCAVREKFVSEVTEFGVPVENDGRLNVDLLRGRRRKMTFQMLSVLVELIHFRLKLFEAIFEVLNGNPTMMSREVGLRDEPLPW